MECPADDVGSNRCSLLAAKREYRAVKEEIGPDRDCSLCRKPVISLAILPPDRGSTKRSFPNFVCQMIKSWLSRSISFKHNRDTSPTREPNPYSSANIIL